MKKPKRPKLVSPIEAAKYKQRQQTHMSDEVRLKILERTIPQFTKHFGNGHCTLYDEMDIMCDKCPLSTHVGFGVHCDMRAVLALLIDDAAKESAKKLPKINLEPFIEVDGVYIEKPKEDKKQGISDRFSQIV